MFQDSLSLSHLILLLADEDLRQEERIYQFARAVCHTPSAHILQSLIVLLRKIVRQEEAYGNVIVGLLVQNLLHGRCHLVGVILKA